VMRKLWFLRLSRTRPVKVSEPKSNNNHDLVQLTQVSAHTGRAALAVRLHACIEFCTMALHSTVDVYRA
jgi:hypothetical protein